MDAHSTSRERQRDPAGADPELERSTLAGQTGKRFDDRRDDSPSAVHRGSRERALADRQQQRRASEHRPLARSLPQAVATRPVAGGGSIEANRPRPWPQQRGRGARVDHRARAAAVELLTGRATGRQRPPQVGQGEGARRSRWRGLGDRRAYTGAMQRLRQLHVGRAQTRG